MPVYKNKMCLFFIQSMHKCKAVGDTYKWITIGKKAYIISFLLQMYVLSENTYCHFNLHMQKCTFLHTLLYHGVHGTLFAQHHVVR